jgi:lipoprotein-anchoring transpeptidase ErfK/SrfK
MMAPVLASEPAVPDARPAVVVDPGVTSVARAVRPLIDVYAAADAPTPMLTLSHPTATGSPLVFVVDGSLGDWLRVRLPVSPPGRVGWVQAEHVDVTEHTMRIVVDLDERSLVVRDGDAVHLRVPIAVGPLDAPPRGTTFVAEVLALANSRTAYGTHVLTLAGHPASADQYFRGRGAVAIHGTDDLEGVRDGRTRGSIALSNAAVARLADSVPAGTPVDVRP